MKVGRRLNSRGVSVTEFVLVLPWICFAMLMAVEVFMLCVKSLELGITARTIYSNAHLYTDINSGQTLSVLDSRSSNNNIGDMTIEYQLSRVTGLKTPFLPDALQTRVLAVPALPQNVTAEDLGGDNPAPYCLTGEGIKPIWECN